MEVLTRFLSYLRYERHHSEKTVESYALDLKQYLSYAKELDSAFIVPSEQDRDVVRSWISSLMDDKYQSSSVQRKLSAIKSFYRFLVRVGELKKNPVSSIRSPRVKAPLSSFLDEPALKELLNDTELYEADFLSVRDQLILEMLFETGIRRAEMCSLRLLDVDLCAMSIKVYGKGGKERIVPFGPFLKKRIEQYLFVRGEKVGLSEFFFVSLKNKMLSGADLYAVVHSKLDHVSGLSRRGPHVFRHTFATVMLNNGADLMSVKELLGHSSVSTTVRYTHTSLAELKKMYNAHPRAQRKNGMEVRIQAVHFTMSQDLEDFVQKKLNRLDRLHDGVAYAEVVLKLDAKGGDGKNKEVFIRLDVPGPDLCAEKVASTFEEAVDLAVDAIKRQIEKVK